MRVQHNINALNAYRQLGVNNSQGAKSLEKLSSGFRINRAGDDAAGLAISEKMRGQIRGLDMASKNAQDGISLIQTAEGALQETHSILQRVRELAVQSSNDTTTDADRIEIQKEVNQLVDEIDRISNDTEFNTQSLLDGSYSNKKFQIGANSGQQMTISVAKMDSSSLGTSVGEKQVLSAIPATFDFSGIGDSAKITVNGKVIDVSTNLGSESGLIDHLNSEMKSVGVSVSKVGTTLEFKGKTGISVALTSPGALFTGTVGASTAATLGETIKSLQDDTLASGGLQTQSQASESVTFIDNAINSVSAERSKLGAVQNRLEHTINNLGTSSENLTAAESRIRDVDMAKEMMEFTKNNILSQAAQAMLAQANQQPQAVLQLLQ